MRRQEGNRDALEEQDYRYQLDYPTFGGPIRSESLRCVQESLPAERHPLRITATWGYSCSRFNPNIVEIASVAGAYRG